jgi:hypothetical protein
MLLRGCTSTPLLKFIHDAAGGLLDTLELGTHSNEACLSVLIPRARSLEVPLRRSVWILLLACARNVSGRKSLRNSTVW